MNEHIPKEHLEK